MSFKVIADFENEVANFFGAPYAVAVDCCTHGLELCLRHKGATKITVPKHTYLSVPMLAEKLDLEKDPNSMGKEIKALLGHMNREKEKSE